MQFSFAEAAWYFLAACDEIHFLSIMKELGGGEPHSISESRSLADNVLVHSKSPMEWIYRKCPPGGSVPSRYSDEAYVAAAKLSQLSRDYLSFESAFSYASWGLVTLSIEGKCIKTAGAMREDARYYAYDRLVNYDPNLGLKPPSDDSIAKMILGSLRVKGESFSYSLNPRLAKHVLEWVGSTLDERFSLPSEWKLPDYTLGEFSAVAKVLWALGFIHDQARLFAATSGCKGGGYSNTLLLLDSEELLQRVRRYSGVPLERISAIVADLTYGSRDQNRPDPALQPLIKLNSRVFGIAPSIMLNSSMERNFTVLLNRIPEARAIYTRLNRDKEIVSRSRIVESLAQLDLDFNYGNVPTWGGAAEIDLAIVSRTERVCLLLELKSFIAPAEAREIKDRSEEIAKGIKQIRDRCHMYSKNPEALHGFLQTDNTYKYFWAVASENSIGASYVQDSDVPVINLRHFLAHLKRVSSLGQTCDWLERRAYLPVDGVNYREIPIKSTIGQWTIEWYGIQILTEKYCDHS